MKHSRLLKLNKVSLWLILGTINLFYLWKGLEHVGLCKDFVMLSCNSAACTHFKFKSKLSQLPTKNQEEKIFGLEGEAQASGTRPPICVWWLCHFNEVCE